MKRWLFLAAVMGGLSVVMGAFAAHGLARTLDARMLTTFETGARYQMVHALAMGLAALAALAARGAAAKRANIAAALFFAGILLFSGSLYLLALTGVSALGMITPVGGVCLIAGWIALALAALKFSEN